MRERPILFSGPMVRAILDGRKTMTRRIVKFPLLDRDIGCELAGNEIGPKEARRLCPYGQPGDHLWVRENGWERPERTPKMMREGADTWEPYYFDADGLSATDCDEFKEWGFKRRPSIHMPRKFCRLTLEVTGARVERLQDISERDALCEGARQCGDSSRAYRLGFTELWQSINAKRVPWASNPWVWVVEFRIKP